MREPKKVRTNSELKKSCHGLRVHNEELKNRIIELETRIILAMRLDYANFPGFITTALHGKNIPEEVSAVTDAICKDERYEP